MVLRSLHRTSDGSVNHHSNYRVHWSQSLCNRIPGFGKVQAQPCYVPSYRYDWNPMLRYCLGLLSPLFALQMNSELGEL